MDSQFLIPVTFLHTTISDSKVFFISLNKELTVIMIRQVYGSAIKRYQILPTLNKRSCSKLYIIDF